MNLNLRSYLQTLKFDHNTCKNGTPVSEKNYIIREVTKVKLFLQILNNLS